LYACAHTCALADADDADGDAHRRTDESDAESDNNESDTESDIGGVQNPGGLWR